MLNTALEQMWKLLLLTGCLALIVFFITTIIIIITTTIDNLKRRKIKDQNIKDLQIMFDELVEQMQKEKDDENVDKEDKE